MTLRHLSPVHGFTYLPPANKVCEGYVFMPVCQSFCSQGVGCGYPSMHCMWYPSMQVSRPTPMGEVEGFGWGGSPDSHLEGSWGVWPGGVSRPHPGVCFQAHTQGGLQANTQGSLQGKLRGLAGGSPGSHPGGSWWVWPGGSPGHTQGGVSTGPHQGEVSQHALRKTPPCQQMATAVGSTHPTGMHSCFRNCTSQIMEQPGAALWIALCTMTKLHQWEKILYSIDKTNLKYTLQIFKEFK